MEQAERWKLEVRQAFGARVREIRLSKDITQEGLALLCGLDRSYLGQVERGERNITLENIHRLALGLEVRPHELLLPPGSPAFSGGGSA